MAEDKKPQLSDEEKIERKTRLFRLISRILIVVAVIVIAVFVYFLLGTRQNISQQTSLDTAELRSKMKQIISLEKKYYAETGNYASFEYQELCKELPAFDPAVDSDFQYMFDAETGIVTGREKNASSDVNGDIDGNDGLTLSVDWEYGVLEGQNGSDFFWTESDIAGFEKRSGRTTVE